MEGLDTRMVSFGQDAMRCSKLSKSSTEKRSDRELRRRSERRAREAAKVYKLVITECLKRCALRGDGENVAVMDFRYGMLIGKMKKMGA